MEDFFRADNSQPDHNRTDVPQTWLGYSHHRRKQPCHEEPDRHFTYILFLIAASRLYDPLSGAMSNMAELFGVSLQVKRLKEIEEYPDENGEKDIRTNVYDITFDHVKFFLRKGQTSIA